LDGKFTPKGAVSKVGKWPVEKGVVTAVKPRERDADTQRVGSGASLGALEQRAQLGSAHGYKLKSKAG